MTQDELDALLNGDIDLNSLEEAAKQIEEKTEKKDGHPHKMYDDKHLVSQLGEVTSESEAKATLIFDNLDVILSKLDEMEKAPENITEIINNTRDIIFETMSIMQYQDIHRQKIERVINTMRSISQLMTDSLNSVSPDGFAPSPKHIDGDKDTDDLVDSDELEALIAQMAKN